MLTITTSRARLLTRSDDVNCAYCKAICQQQQQAQPRLEAEVELGSASSRPKSSPEKKTTSRGSLTYAARWCELHMLQSDLRRRRWSTAETAAEVELSSESSKPNPYQEKRQKNCKKKNQIIRRRFLHRFLIKKTHSNSLTDLKKKKKKKKHFVVMFSRASLRQRKPRKQLRVSYPPTRVNIPLVCIKIGLSKAHNVL